MAQHKLLLVLPAFLWITALMYPNPQPALAGAPYQPIEQVEVRVEDESVRVDYGSTITFRAKIQAHSSVRKVSVSFRAQGSPVTHEKTGRIASDGSVNIAYDSSGDSFPPFSRFMYWFNITLKDGLLHASPIFSFTYNDNRFPWQAVDIGNLSVHWYAGDDAFGYAALDSAHAALRSIDLIVTNPANEAVDIYIYSNIEDFKSVLGKDGRIDPAYDVVLVAIAPGPGQLDEMQTQIPNNLTRIILYRALADGYSRQPTWLLEGLAASMELHSRAEYADALESALRDQSLIPMNNLCASFPTDAGNAFLALAQSASFVSYLRSTYGPAGVSRLIDSFREGYDCELGATQALGVSLSQLDARWRETLTRGSGVLELAMTNLLPYLILMLLAFALPILGTINIIRIRSKRGE